jgi:zinc transport system substrate-binding protein
MKLALVFLSLCGFIFAQVSTTVSIVPQKFFVEKIGGDKVSVNVMVQPGSSPATYEPSPKQMVDLSNSQIYFSIGVPFEKRWLPRFKDVAKNTTFVDVSSGIVKQAIADHTHGDEESHDTHDHDHHAHHDHDDGHVHEHAELDPHVWLSPRQVRVVAKNIYEALIAQDASNSAFYKQNYDTFIKELVALDEKIKQNLSNLSSHKFIVFHPSWGYFARDYALEQVAIEIEGKEPKQKDLMDLIDFAKKEGIKVVFVSPEFSQKSAKTIAQNINGITVSISPLAPKWDENLLQMSEKLKEVLD